MPPTESIPNSSHSASKPLTKPNCIYIYSYISTMCEPLTLDSRKWHAIFQNILFFLKLKLYFSASRKIKYCTATSIILTR